VNERDTGARSRSWAVRVGIPLLLALSATSLLLAPLAMPDGYSWVLHTTSESAAQGLKGAWVARLGFLLFGLSVLWLAGEGSREWGKWGSVLGASFGTMMLGTAAFSHRPWLSSVPFDPFEDLLHSITATGMGFAFAGLVVAVGLNRQDARTLDRSLDGLAVVASVVLPLAMSSGIPTTGLLQRSMFAVAYVWYLRESYRGAL